jgi:hypothetical protein
VPSSPGMIPWRRSNEGERNGVSALILRDALLRNAPQDEGGRKHRMKREE